MKRTPVTYCLLTILLIGLPSLLSAQRHSYLEWQMKQLNQTPSVQYQKEKLECIPINDTTICIYSPDRAFLYLGSGSESKSGRNAFADGYGIARYVIPDAATGAMQVEYSLCPWKRGSRHGEGLARTPDGTILKAKWTWDQLKGVSEETPSEAELAEFNLRLTRLEAVMRLLGWNRK